MIKRWLKGLGVVSGFLALSVQAAPERLNLYINADFTHSGEAITSIERGIRVALDEVDSQVQGIPVVINHLDHRGNAVRQRRNSAEVVADDHHLAMFSGVHSTTLIPNLKFINENHLLTLVPWAAGGPVTRFASEPNWIFRLSIDDARAGPFLVRYAVQKRQCSSSHMLLERTPWGESSLKSMSQAFEDLGRVVPHVTWFNYGLSESTARILMREIAREGHDCLLLVANDAEARTLFDAMESLPDVKDLQVISHWGMVAGDFWKGIPGEDAADTRMRFIQPCFTFNGNDSLTPFQQAVFDRLKSRDPEINQATDLKAQAGFVNAYDLTRLLLAALERVTLSDDMDENRARLRTSFETLAVPVQGLLKEYREPFERFDAQASPNGHEALDETDFCMGQFKADGSIFLEPR